MNKKNSTLNTSKLTHDDNIRSRIRRLRIQEGILLQSLQKPNKYDSEDKNSSATELNTSEYQNSLLKIKDSYIYLKNLFDEVRTTTQSQELLADLDIDDMKKKVFEMESTIKAFKAEINTELSALKESFKRMNEIPAEVDQAKWRPKTTSITYNSIVPSPVRVLMSSPFKCSVCNLLSTYFTQAIYQSNEVQQFQDFLQNSPNRYGGWNEYNHNIFVKYWQKYFGKNNGSESQDKSLLQSVTHDAFIEDVAPRLHDVRLTDVTTHVQWYSKYLQLKENQQSAIEKWKISKMAVKKVLKKVKYADEYDSLPLETTMDDNNVIACHFTSSKQDHFPNSSADFSQTRGRQPKGKISKQSRASTLLKPTKQWLNRNQNNCDDAIGLSEFQCIENIDKLGTPHWRHGL